MPSPARSTACRSAALAAYLVAARCWCWRAGTIRSRSPLSSLLVAATVAIAWRARGGGRGAAGGRAARRAGDRALGARPRGRAPGRAVRAGGGRRAGAGQGRRRLASRARRRLCGAVRRRRFLRAGPLGARRSFRCCGAPARCSRRSPSSPRSTIASPGSSPRSRSPAAALLLAALYALATEMLDKRAPRPGAGRRGRAVRDRRGRRAGARAHHGAREGLAHGRARADGAGHRLGGASAPLPALRWLAAVIGVIVLVRIGWEPRIVGATSAPRRSSTGCSTATAFRPPRSGSAATCCAAAPTTCPRA